MSYLKIRKTIYTELLELENRLKFSYKRVKMGWWWWYLFTDSTCDYKFVISVDIAEGLGIDYSIINIFKIGENRKS
jgi:hypothetical protein